MLEASKADTFILVEIPTGCVLFIWTDSLLESNYQKNMTTRADILCRRRIDELFSSIEHENPKIKKLAFG